MTMSRRALLKAALATPAALVLASALGTDGASALKGPGATRLDETDTAGTASVGGLAGPVRDPWTPSLPFATGPLNNDIVVSAAVALTAMNARDRQTYTAAVRNLAYSVGARIGVDPGQLDRIWSLTDGTRMRVLLSALTQVGVPYHYRGETPGRAFDCSGLVSWAWSSVGVQLPRQSTAIIQSVPNTSLAQVRPADVLWYPGHVMLSLGVADAFVHAPYTGEWVEVRAMYANHQSGVRVGVPIP